MKQQEFFDEFMIDAKLGINTTGRSDEYSDDHIYPYEPTTYAVLDRMVESGYITESDYLIDYGSGKGRVPIYLNYRVGLKSTGIEMMEEFYSAAIDNLNGYNKHRGKVEFINTKAEKFDYPTEANAAFFFNPFSIEIMKSVVNKILDSYYENPRRIRLFIYYPQDEYIAFLMNVDELEFVDEIDCKDIFALDENRNRIMIFETNI